MFAGIYSCDLKMVANFAKKSLTNITEFTVLSRYKQVHGKFVKKQDKQPHLYTTVNVHAAYLHILLHQNSNIPFSLNTLNILITHHYTV